KRKLRKSTRRLEALPEQKRRRAMREKISFEAISRRMALSMLGLVGALALMTSALIESEADAQEATPAPAAPAPTAPEEMKRRRPRRRHTRHLQRSGQPAASAPAAPAQPQ